MCLGLPWTIPSSPLQFVTCEMHQMLLLRPIFFAQQIHIPLASHRYTFFLSSLLNGYWVDSLSSYDREWLKRMRTVSKKVLSLILFRLGPGDKYIQPDAANFNSWRRHMKLNGVSPEEIVYAWEDVKAMFNGVRAVFVFHVGIDPCAPA